jgi:hypothetical protein
MLKKSLLCRKCGATWKHDTGKTRAKCWNCGASKDARDRREYARNKPNAAQRLAGLKQWSKDPANRKAKNARDRELLKKRIFAILGDKCARCGCSDARLLEINHKNGGGKREMESGRKSWRFYWDIALGKRKPDDLEILCRPCNALHYLELKFGPLPMRVIWEGGDGVR